MNTDLLETLEQTLTKTLNFKLKKYTAIPGGSSNKLFKLNSTEGKHLLLTS